MKLGTFYGVGIGPGDPKYLTLRAVEVLRSVDKIFTVISKNSRESISQSVVNSVKTEAEICLQVFSMSKNAEERQAKVEANAKEIIAALEQGKNCAFASLGDVMTYSTFGYILKIIKEKLPNLDIEIVPGITSFACLAAKSQRVLAENDESLHIVPSFTEEQAKDLVFPKKSTSIVLKSYRSKKALCERLQNEDNIEIIYGEQLGLKNEQILCNLNDIAALPEKYFSLMMIKKG